LKPLQGEAHPQASACTPALVLRWFPRLVVFGALGLLHRKHCGRSSGLTSLPWWQEIQVVDLPAVSTRHSRFNTVPALGGRQDIGSTGCC